MQFCRFCGRIIPTETRYDPGELCICRVCEAEHRKQNEKVAEMLKSWIGKDESNEDLQEGIRSIYQAEEDAEGPGSSCRQAEEAAGPAREDLPAPGAAQGLPGQAATKSGKKV